VKSKPGEGTTFTIILPVASPADETGPAISQEKPLVSTSSKEEN
jgi:hypothetical protein